MTVPTTGRDAALLARRRDEVRRAVDTWSGQLIDLGGRNQLLYYRDLTVGTLDLADAAPEAVESLISGRTVAMRRMFPADVLPDRLKRARAIRNKAREGLEERGIVTCFLAMGIATWTDVAGTKTPAAPVLLQEASIAAVGVAEDDFQIALTGDPQVNPTMLHLLGEQFQLKLTADELLAEASSTPDVAGLFQVLRRRAAAVPGFSIAPRRIIGTFSYAKLPMVNDLEVNLDALFAHDVVAAISGDQNALNALSDSGS